MLHQEEHREEQAILAMRLPLMMLSLVLMTKFVR